MSALSVATYATHDHKPLRALWEEAFEERAPTTEQARQRPGEDRRICRDSPHPTRRTDF